MKRVCITGANSGIGMEAARIYAEQGYGVTMFCRDRERGEQARNKLIETTRGESIDLILCDMSSMESVRRAVQEFRSGHDSLDVLINNAANFNLEIKKAVMTAEGHELIWATNHLGPFLLSTLLAESLERGKRKRIINICSKGLTAFPSMKINYKDPGFLNRRYSVVRAYYHSKLAQEMTTVELAERWAPRGIMVAAIKVPAVKVAGHRLPNISKFKLKMYELKQKRALEPARIAEVYYWLGDSEAAAVMNGKIIDEKCRETHFAAAVHSTEKRRRLMEMTEAMVGAAGHA